MSIRLIAFGLLLAAAVAVQGQPWTTGTFTYDGAGNITAMGTDTFVYDSAGRLVKGTADQQRTGGSNRQEYAYDAFGNRVVLTTVGTDCVGGCPPIDLQISAANNRITNHGAGYDLAGNVTSLDGYTFNYDPAGMMAEQIGPPSTGPIDWQYVYTADDERIATYSGGGNWRFTVRDLDGKVLREVTASTSGGQTTWSWDRDHIFRGGLLQATISPSGQQQFHLDHLGNPRLVTNAAGAQTGIHSYYPFGDELTLTPAESPTGRLKYTGHERDETSSVRPLDYMHARFYGPTVGRFLSPDPIRGHRRYTQSWNGYSYVLNSPLTYTDPTGLVFECVTVPKSDGTVQQICSERIEVHGQQPTVDPRPIDATGWSEFFNGGVRKQLASLEDKAERVGRAGERMAHLWEQCVERIAAPYLIGDAAMVSGVVVAGAGNSAASAGIGALGPTYGASSTVVAGGLVGIAAGGYLFTVGVTVNINQTNKLFGTHIPSPSDRFAIFPNWPAKDSVEHSSGPCGG